MKKYIRLHRRLICGDTEALGCRAYWNMVRKKITVAADGMKISVIGLGLEIASMDRSSLSLKGRIASVEMRR